MKKKSVSKKANKSILDNQKVTNLSTTEMENVQGGLTYSALPKYGVLCQTMTAGKILVR